MASTQQQVAAPHVLLSERYFLPAGSRRADADPDSTEIDPDLSVTAMSVSQERLADPRSDNASDGSLCEIGPNRAATPRGSVQRGSHAYDRSSLIYGVANNALQARLGCLHVHHFAPVAPRRAIRAAWRTLTQENSAQLPRLQPAQFTSFW